MNDEPKPKIETLELNRETVKDLTENEAEAVAGGREEAVGRVCMTSTVCCRF